MDLQALTVGSGDEIPELPPYNISKVDVHQIDSEDGSRAMAADVAVSFTNEYPVDLHVPPMAFSILVDNCLPELPYIQLAYSITKAIHIKPKEDVHINVRGTVRRLPEALVSTCPGSNKSPLDVFVGQYIHGDKSKIYVRGSDSPSSQTPRWITDLVKDITVPIPVSGHPFGHLIKNFTLDNAHVSLPDPLAEPGTPAAQPKMDANVKVVVALPEEMNFPINVSRVRANADIYYQGAKMGRLDLQRWQDASSSRISPRPGEAAALLVESQIRQAPLQITDDDVFTEVIQALIFGKRQIRLTMKAAVDVEMQSGIGAFAIRDIPAEGSLPVKPFAGHGIGSFAPQIGDMKIVDSTRQSLTLQARANISNPTQYSATVPEFSFLILSNGTVIGKATGKNMHVRPGLNENLIVEALWEPTMGGEKGLEVGRELLSQYISGESISHYVQCWSERSLGYENVTLTVKTYNGSIPAQPAFGKALESLELTMPFPKMKVPSRPGHEDDDDGSPHFIDEATVRLTLSISIRHPT